MRKPPPQAVAGSGQAALHGAQRPAQLVRCLIVGQALKVAEHKGQAVSLGEPIDFLVELRAGIGAGPFAFGSCGHFATSPFVRATPGGGRLGLGRDPQGDAVQPAPERFRFLDRSSLPGQNQERGLAGVLSVMVVADHLPADEENHRRVAFHQGRKRGLGGIPRMRDEPREQLSIAKCS